MNSNLKTIRLMRTGQRPLSFRGRLLKCVCSRQIDGKGKTARKEPRWFKVSLYKTARDTYVCSVKYVSKWNNEEGFSTAYETRDPIEGFKLYDVESHVEGFPPTMPDKQKQLLKCLRRRYKQAVTDLIAGLPELDEVLDGAS